MVNSSFNYARRPSKDKEIDMVESNIASKFIDDIFA